MSLPALGLLADWCAAIGRDRAALDRDELATFLVQVPLAVSTVRRLTGRLGLADPVQPARRMLPEPSWLPTGLWPGGFAARRDAVLITLLDLGYTNRKAVDLRTRDVRLVPVPQARMQTGWVDLPMTRTGMDCPSCVLTRWLRALTAWDVARGGNQFAAEELITADGQATPGRQHDCAAPVPDGWQQVTWLIPGIDRHGHLNPHRPITIRAGQAVLARARRLPDPHDVALAPSPTVAACPRPAESPQPRGVPDDLPELLDRLEALLDEQTHRMDALLDHAQ